MDDDKFKDKLITHKDTLCSANSGVISGTSDYFQNDLNGYVLTVNDTHTGVISNHTHSHSRSYTNPLENKLDKLEKDLTEVQENLNSLVKFLTYKNIIIDKEEYLDFIVAGKLADKLSKV